MKIAACSTVLNEADVVGATVGHLYEQGVSNVYIADGMSTDGTRDVLSQFPCKVFDDDSPIHRQPYWISRLAELAFEDGCDFVIPFDADEWWVATQHDNLHEAFSAVPADVSKLYATMYHHYTWDEREQNPKPFPKVAFRAAHHIKVSNGNHDVKVSGGSQHGWLEVRELQYRGEEHFVRKVRERNATLDPSLPSSEGGHHNRFATYTDDELREWWRQENPFWGPARTVVHDPIPSKFKVGVRA